VGGDGLVVSDYNRGVFKIGFDGSVRWGPAIEASAAKISRILHSSNHYHEPGYGGDYIAVINTIGRGVFEVRDDGGVVWSCGAKPWDVQITNVFWPLAAHSAFRMGFAELGGQLTVMGFEAGGGIVAVDKECRPRWGVMKPFTNPGGAWIYRPTSYGLMETTHVFPTLRGTIGFIDWSGRYGSVVGEVIELPYHQTLWFLLAQDHDPGDGGTYYDPPLEAGEWREVKLFFINLGVNSLDYTVYVTNYFILGDPHFPSHWKMLTSGSVPGGSTAEIDASGYLGVRVFGKRTTAGASSRWKIVVILRR
jgi:hypothetical protein